MTRRRDPVFDENLNQMFGPLHVPVLDKVVPSADLLATLDPELYEARLGEWLDANLDSTLGRDTLPHHQFEANRQRFDVLAKLVALRRVVPFVGAGASASCGVPTWTQYLRKMAAEHMYPSAILERYIAEGQYEDAATGILRHVGEGPFRESFDRSFGNLPTPAAHTLASAIVFTFDGPIITTNYDQLLERGAMPAFQTFLGSVPGEFLRAAREGRRVLLKIHGDLYQPGSRVLTKKEYNRAYGPLEAPDMSRDLPRVLRWAFLRDTVIFLGASLSNDRTMHLLHALTQDKIEGPSMRHFAIVEFPSDTAVAQKRAKFLQERSIFPIWYATDQHFRVPILVQHLARVAKEFR